MRLSTRLTIAIVALAGVTATAVGLFTYRNISAIVMPRALDRVEAQARMIATTLAASVQGARADIIGFRSAVAMDETVQASAGRGTDSDHGIAIAQWRNRLASRFAAELTAKPSYAQFRIIGVADGGRELVRVDRSGPGGDIRVAPDTELRRQGDEDHFRQAIRLPAGGIYVSPVDLSKERGVVEIPHVPTLRVAAPIVAPDGTPFGIVIVNVDLRPVLNHVRWLVPDEGPVYLVNERGDYLLHADPNREFGFALGTPVRVQDEFPASAELLTTVNPTSRFIEDRAGGRFGVGWQWVRLADGPRIAVMKAAPYSELMAPAIAVRDSSFLAALAAACGAFGLAVILARSLARPLTEMTKAVERFSHDGTVMVPTRGNGEIGVLSAAFARMSAEVRDKTAALTREVEQRRRLFETSLDLILVTDRHGNFVQVSPSSAAILGYAPDEMIGRNAVAFIHPDDLEATQDEMRHARQGQDTRNFETRYVHKNGSAVTLNWTGVWSEPEQQHYFIGRDMTESKRAEEALRDSEQMARGIIDTALDAFVQMDAAGNIREWNARAETIFGWSREEVLGKNLVGLVMPEDRAGQAAGLERFLRAGEAAVAGKRIELEAKRRGGTKIKAELAVTALSRRTGYVFNVFIRDITEKIAQEEQLRQSQKMEAVGQLTGGIAHDFNNMLTVIIGTSEILAEELADQPQLAAIAKMIDQAAERGGDLTRRLLAFARKQALQPRETEINELLIESAKLLKPTLGENVEIETRLADNAWTALIDPSQLSSALVNLAVNARDAMPNGGKLTLETANVVLDEGYVSAHNDVRPGSYVMVAVTDTGMGIPPALRNKVFEPFFTTKETGKGTGLGLSMVYGFVKQSGGHIKVYSEQGIGTTIKLYLPRAEADAGQQSDDDLAAAALGGKETILLVEDNELVRRQVTMQLETLGYTSLSAANAAEALALIDAGAKPDLLFTDVIMPGGMNGSQLAQEIAKRQPAIKVLFTSGYTENAMLHQGRLDPGVLLLAKPYRKADLARLLRRALSPDGGGVAEERRAASADTPKRLGQA
jgi:PAS domain S-box-containing protein